MSIHLRIIGTQQIYLPLFLVCFILGEKAALSKPSITAEKSHSQSEKFREQEMLLSKKDEAVMPAKSDETFPPLALENRESKYQELQEKYFQPFYKQGVSEKLTLRDGYALAHRYYENKNAKGTIVLIQGRTETSFKYAEQIYDFFQMGYSVFTFDFRGQGYSKHLVEEKPSYGHIDSFETYREDLREYLSQVVLPRKKGKVLAYCHSMGAAVGAFFQIKYPGSIDGFIWQSPMFDINTGPFPYWFARMLVGTMDFIGLGKSLPPMQEDFKEDEKNNVTTSAVRRAYVFDQRVREREALIGPATAGWAFNALKVTRMIQSESHQISVPSLIFEAGIDPYVNSGGMETVCSSVKGCQKILFKDGMHELYLEKDSIRAELLQRLDKFFAGI